MATEWTWITEFVNELVLRLRPDIGARFARTIALTEWVAHQKAAPRKAAATWARNLAAQVDGTTLKQ